MKIKTTTYKVKKINNRDIRLQIGLEIELPNNKCETAAIIQLYPIAYFADKVPQEIFSMLYISAIVYAIDRSVEREKYSIDGWSREFEVDFLLPGYEKYESQVEHLNSMLSFLTGDYWTCNFVGGVVISLPKYKKCTYFDGITQVNLFSGGLDSLIGAIDYMTQNPHGKLFLSSHYDSNMSGPRNDQFKIKSCFAKKYAGRYVEIDPVMIGPLLSSETTCRSRSFMFISLALVVATYSTCNVVIPENGSVSINYPLSISRRSSCSTRTTHPVFLKKFQNVLKSIGSNVILSNPYDKNTKGEMVRACADKQYLLSILAKSNSCGKRGTHQFYYDNHCASHCGHCMPCMYRRASLVGEVDSTTYGNTFERLLSMKGSKVSEDFFAMLEFVKRDLTRQQIREELIISGMISFSDLDDYVELVVRTRAELELMLKDDNNPKLNAYMGW